MSELSGSHDQFFKQLLSSPEALADFLRNCLPESLAKLIDPGSARLVKGSFVDKRLRDHFSDILCSVRLSNGNAAYVYALLEHKSFPDRWVAFQLLRYMVKIWERDFREFRQRKGKSKKNRTRRFRLVPIIPVVVYHGKAKWKVSESLSALFDAPAELDSFVPDFKFLLSDLSAYSDEEIKGAALLKAGLLVMKYIFSDELGEKLPGILALLRDMANSRTGLEYLEALVLYLLKGSDKLTEKDLGKALESALPEKGGELMTTLAEKWFEEGRQEGHREGRRKGHREGRREGRREGERQAMLNIIETGLRMKFGVDGARLFENMVKIDNLRILESIQERLWTAESLDEIRSCLQ